MCVEIDLALVVAPEIKFQVDSFTCPRTKNTASKTDDFPAPLPPKTMVKGEEGAGEPTLLVGKGFHPGQRSILWLQTLYVEHEGRGRQGITKVGNEKTPLS